MTIEAILAGMGALFATIAGVITYIVRVPRKLKTDQFIEHWKELQNFCRDKKQWPQALEEADKLLDTALKRRKFKGKSMGERMVSAQRTFTDNDSAWFAHNLNKKLIANPTFRLRESDVKDALMGFRQALRDVGALPQDKKPTKDVRS